jgi:hypothetical protein
MCLAPNLVHFINRLCECLLPFLPFARLSTPVPLRRREPRRVTVPRTSIVVLVGVRTMPFCRPPDVFQSVLGLDITRTPPFPWPRLLPEKRKKK